MQWHVLYGVQWHVLHEVQWLALAVAAPCTLLSPLPSAALNELAAAAAAVSSETKPMSTSSVGGAEDALARRVSVIVYPPTHESAT